MGNLYIIPVTHTLVTHKTCLIITGLQINTF